MPKVIKSKTKIPTFLGLILLLIALILGVSVYYYQDLKSNQRKTALSPKNIEIINISNKFATITWNTDTAVKGEVALKEEGQTKETYFKDDRDRIDSKSRNTHFVTMQNLKPETKYSFKIKSDEQFYSEGSQAFQTAKALEESNQSKNTQPLTGAVIDDNLQPVEGALIHLNINGASKIGTFSNSEGNFILPLKALRTENLSALYSIDSPTNANLVISKNNLSSIIEFTLPLKNSSFQTLPLGRNINLREYFIAAEKNPDKPAAQKEVSFDLNGDGKVNSVDLSIVVQNFGKRFDNKQMDFNSDGEVDQKDIELFIKSVPN